jgi:NAD(P)-dependent dehydrogenase (short-subunit alcohol dehydrogenase family)
MNLKPIEDQVVVVVGATSGIGRATALRFGERGAKTVIGGRSLAELELLAGEIRAAGGDAAPMILDVSEFDQVKALADFAVERFGRIDTWVQLASVSIYATFEETRPDEFKRVVDVNLVGAAYGAMAALPNLKRAGGGALIEVSSVEAVRALPLQSAYTASKHGMRGFLDALRMELKHENQPIAVTNIMPSSINTPFFDKALTRLGVKPMPVPPIYAPELVADAILYAAEHPVREMVVGGSGKGLELLHRLSPGLAERLVAPVAFRGQYTDEPKPADAPHNLYTHLPGYDRVKGEFSEVPRPASLFTWFQLHPQVRFGLALSAAAAAGIAAVRAFRSRGGRKSPVRKWTFGW